MSAPGRAAAGGILAFLRRLPLLAGLSDQHLAGLAGNARRLRVPAGTLIMREGTAGDGLYVVLRGQVEVTRAGPGGELLLARQGRGSFLGEMALLGGAPRTATVRALADSTLLVIAPEAFQQLLVASPAATVTVLHAVAARLAATETELVRQERLASLGTMAAGLAHELNNPAAAAAASAAQLERGVQELEQRTLRLGPDAAALARTTAVDPEVPVPAAAHVEFAEDEEEELAGWLAECRCRAPRLSAHSLLACGWTLSRLQAAARVLPLLARGEFLDWLSARCELSALTRDLLAASRAISDVVAAVRGHANLDRPAHRPVDLRASLEAALVVTRSRWKGGVTVRLDTDPDLPAVEARAGELSQVWANLITNAVEAMRGRGRLEITVRARAEHVVISFADDGPGIPPALRARIFEPFFTTRADEGGGGLGLHIARSIVVHGHGGRLDVRSRPGRTVFSVLLPLRLAAQRAA